MSLQTPADGMPSSLSTLISTTSSPALDCSTHLMLGTVGSLLLNHPLPLLTSSLACLPMTAAETNLNDGLAAYYPFNGNANDESGHRNNGIIYGAKLAEDRFGNSNSAYYFDGRDDYIDLGNSESIDVGGGSFSLSAEVKFASANNDRNDHYDVITKRASSRNGWCFQFGLSRLPSEIKLWSYSDTEKSAHYNFEIDTWYHVLVVRDVNNSKLGYYINGDLISSVTYSNQDLRNSGRAIIGRLAELNQQYFYGTIDELRIYNRALPAAEIDALYQLNFKAPTEPTLSNGGINLNDGLLEYYPFNGNANDESEHGYDGVVRAATLTSDWLGRPNQAYFFDRDNHNKLGIDLPMMAVPQDITISLIFKLIGPITYKNWQIDLYSVFGHNDGAHTLVLGYQPNNGAVRPHVLAGNRWQIDESNHVPWTDKTWYQVAMTYDSNLRSMTAYLNNTILSRVGNISPPSGNHPHVQLEYHIGSTMNYVNPPNVFASIIIDEVRIYNRALSAAEIDALYQLNFRISTESTPSTSIPPINGNSPIATQPIDDQTMTTNQKFTLDLKKYFKTSNSEPLIFSVRLGNEDKLPPWLGLNPQTGLLTGIPHEPAHFHIVITATNAKGQTAMLDFSLMVKAPALQSKSLLLWILVPFLTGSSAFGLLLMAYRRFKTNGGKEIVRYTPTSEIEPAPTTLHQDPSPEFNLFHRRRGQAITQNTPAAEPLQSETRLNV